MLTDEMMRQAAGEVELAMLASLSAKDIAPHKFSDRFEKKMKKLINKVKYPIRYNVLRLAAAIILIIFTIFGSLVAFSPEVRASVINWIKTTFFEYTQYSGTEHHNNAEYEYSLKTIPDGYFELTVIESDDGKTFVYANEEGYMLNFSYAKGTMAHNLFVKTDSHLHSTGIVAGNQADIYISNNAEETSGIVWQDNETDVLLCISANVDAELLIKLAESVIKTPK